jgi:alpha-tubulin suppressor-like RCC1 family protein
MTTRAALRPSARRASLAGWFAAAMLVGGCGARSQLTASANGDASSGSNSGSSGGSGGSGGGGNGAPCVVGGALCADPPAPTCESTTTLTTYDPAGACVEGKCVYTPSAAACPAECSGGMCLPMKAKLLLTVGSQHTCVTAPTGGIKCWGHNDSGQLGDSSTLETGVPTAVTGLSTGMLALTASADTCAVTAAGAALCWGDNGFGQLGNGATQSSLSPIGVNGLSSGVVDVAAGGLHTCAVLASGAVRCWGDNSTGDLGDGTVFSSLVPVDVKGLSGLASAVTLGFGHSCALTAAGAVQCWGLNKYGELGNGTTSELPGSTPVVVKGLSADVISIAANSLHTCALTSVGAVKCWGHNVDGELGDGTFNDSAVPVDVQGLSSGVLAIGAGTGHTCAVTAGGGVKCWGGNAFGQLGDSSTSKSPFPVDVVGLSSGVVTVALGYDHTCAALATGAVKCWGGNFYSQLGNGTTDESHVPVDVIGL